MSKARTLADFISDGSEFADGTISVAEVSGAAPLASPTFTGNIDAGDNVKLRLGDSDDLQLYHDGQNSYVSDTAVGDLKITSNGANITFEKADGTDIFNVATSGATTAYFNGNPKIATSSTGAVITGDVGATTATITGKTTTDELDLNAIAATISDTAVDIFVYDTRKDSDGGAWRKRTQHTSWYNETLNTSTRGSRKEFPAVAVIVAETTQVTIYDGDDPDLPMWMVFNTGGNWNHILVSTSGYVTCVAMLNGHLVIGRNLNTGWQLTKTSFVDDSSYGYKNAAHGTSDGVWTGGIVARNGNGSYYDNGVASNILSPYNNDVAMTVLPNAPIDAATGLPVPTIAVATNGGVSVIKDDGIVVDLTTGDIYDNYRTVDFTKNNRLMYTTGTGTSMAYTADIPSSDYNLSYYNTTGTGSARNEYFAGLHGGGTLSAYPVRFHGGNVSGQTVSTSAGEHIAFGTYSSNATEEMGLTLLDEMPDNPNQSSVVWLNSEYNTGHMVGAIKLATLSDTDATNVTGSELVTNGTFDSNITGWTAYNATLSHVNGAIRVADNGGYTKAYQAISTVVGKKYTVTAEVVAITGLNSALAVGSENPETNAWGNATGQISSSTTGVLSATFTATATTMYVELGSEGTNSVDYDNVSVRLAEEDRSVNGNGLQVFGTVTKSAVATGADLVAYSGFSSSNYLQQPYNSGLDFGTGDWCYMWWQKMDSVTNGMTVFGRDAIGEGGTSAGRIGCYFNSDKLRVDLTDDGASSYTGKLSSQSVVGLTGWNCFVIIRRGSNFEFYINGKFDSSVALGATGDGSYTNTSATLSIGYDVNVGAALSSGALALFRASATAPSPEQIKKIYEDEKVLFQEGAQATLYGSSDAVTALAYDDSTELLHVGTSAGRSVFQGLRRVDNTTTAVGAAISASNGLVADE